ncbi:MAG TPA: 3-phytase, partial [Hyphomonas atlantica]|nr:3-phytase [Hyphomonas atlantica]
MKRYLPLAALLVSACATEPAQDLYAIETAPIPAAVETAPMVGKGDKADDPAVWVNLANPAASLVLGTNKDAGLYVYNLAGEELQFLDVGRVNNVDLRGDLAVASNDETNSVSWFTIDSTTNTVSHIGDTPTNKDEPYGICAGLVGNTYYAMPTYKDGVA